MKCSASPSSAVSKVPLVFEIIVPVSHNIVFYVAQMSETIELMVVNEILQKHCLSDDRELQILVLFYGAEHTLIGIVCLFCKASTAVIIGVFRGGETVDNGGNMCLRFDLRITNLNTIVSIFHCTVENLIICDSRGVPLRSSQVPLRRHGCHFLSTFAAPGCIIITLLLLLLYFKVTLLAKASCGQGAVRIGLLRFPTGGRKRGTKRGHSLFR